MQANINVSCRGCSKDVLMSDVTLDEDSGVYLCNYCVNRNNKYDSKPKNNQELKSKVIDQPSLTNYVCMDCNYSFTRKESITVHKCPYCAKPNLVVK